MERALSVEVLSLDKIDESRLLYGAIYKGSLWGLMGEVIKWMRPAQFEKLKVWNHR